MEKHDGTDTAFLQSCHATMQLANIYPVCLLQKDQFPERFHFKDSTIKIKKTRREDAGLYLLEATNDLGEKSKEVFLTVQYHAE